MKKYSLITVCCLLINAISFAQLFPDYGILYSEDINLKQCSFDKDANAVILMNEANSDYDEEHHLVTNHHVRIKILKEKGFSSANVSVPFYRKDDFERINGVEGMTINIVDGQQLQTKLERKSIFTQNTNERYGEVIFAFPAIKVGSVIDYKYQSVMKSYGGLDDWSFQDELPVITSKYTIIILPNMEFAYRVNKSPGIPIIVKAETGRGGAYFEMHNIPGLGNEPYMDARRDYLQKVVFQLSSYGSSGFDRRNYMTSWDEVTRELMQSTEFGNQLGKNIPGTDDFMKQAKTLSSPEEKMKLIFNYVRSNVKWNGLYSKYAIEGVKDAWQKKSGSSGDINLLLVNLLREGGIESYPMLVSERFYGKVNTNYPFVDQFNSVFACVIIHNRKYYLDATDKAIPPHLTPFNILNTTAFIVNRKAGGLINITNDTLQYKEYILADLSIKENGELSGEAFVKSMDYARMEKLVDYRTETAKFLKKYFTLYGTAIVAKDLEVSNLENDSLAFEQHCKLSGNLNSSGGYTFLPLNFFTGFDDNPFIDDNRFSNINFGYRRSINLNITVQLPPNYTADEIPKSVKLSNPENDIVFVRRVEYDSLLNTVKCMMQFEFKKSLYATDMYANIQAMYKKIFEYLKEPVLLKKK